MNSTWASLGGYGNVDVRAPLPVGRAGGNGGALGLIMQALMRGSSMRSPSLPEQGYDPEAELEMARLLGLLRQEPGAKQASLGAPGPR